jgi:serine/threonine protein kinase
MTPERWQKLRDLFERAADGSAEERSQILRQIHAQDRELADELAKLLQAHDRPTPRLDQPFVRLPAPQRLFFDGQLVLGRFEIIRFLGAGGMGEVYEANDRQMGRIALKTVRRDFSWDERILSRLREEVHIARQIADPHVCRVYEFFPIPAQDESPETACFTMEFLDGRTLSHYIEESGPLRWPQFKQLALDICDGLQAIHEANFIHRDLKTSNIMLVERAGRLQAVVMDLGLVRKSLAVAAAASGSGVAGISGAARVVGTPQYMAPEQFQGETVTPATDVYALAVVFYEMLLGRHAFESSTPIGAAAERAKPLARISSARHDVAPEVDQVIERCLKYDPVNRYQSAREVAHALEATQSASGIARKARRYAGGHRFVTVLVALVMLASIAVITLSNRPVEISPDALQWYDKGLAALREGSYVTAISALERAVGHEQNFALAHARLAEAYSELDFKGRADHEMLLASTPSARTRASKLDRDYLQATRDYVTENLTAAVADYKRILRELPDGQKGIGYLDIGRAEQRSGDIPGALQAYSQAALLPPESPAPFLRRAILEGRENQSDAADRDFDRAAALYGPNLEGKAEVNYQRGYVASTHGQLPEARKLINKSLQEAEEIRSTQLMARALLRLAVINYGEDNYDQAIEHANQAIDTAHEQELNYWAIEARIRLANIYRDRGKPGDFDKADAQLRHALDIAQKNNNPRIVALAHWSLASLCNQQDKPDETIAHATAALVYYRNEHFANESLSCLTLIGRAKLDRSDFSDALHRGFEALALARKDGNAAMIYPAEELIGSVYLKLEQYPNALQHFQAALAASREAGQQSDYEVLHCAEALSRLGQYSDAQKAFAEASATPSQPTDKAFESLRVLASINLNRQKYRNVLQTAKQAVALATNLPPSATVKAQILLAQAYAHLGSITPEIDAYPQIRALAEKLEDRDLAAKFDYAWAQLSLRQGQLEEGKSLAQSAFQFASSAGEMESEWQDLLCLAELSDKLRDRAAARNYGRKALDIFSELEHNWGSRVYKQYESRPDVEDSIKKLLEMTRS